MAHLLLLLLAGAVACHRPAPSAPSAPSVPSVPSVPSAPSVPSVPSASGSEAAEAATHREASDRRETSIAHGDPFFDDDGRCPTARGQDMERRRARERDARREDCERFNRLPAKEKARTKPPAVCLD